MVSNERMQELKGVLYSAVIADILDAMGVKHPTCMRGDIRPADPDAVIFGRAFTVLATDVYEVQPEPYKLELEAVDGVRAGEVLVATTNGSTASGFWGELLSTCAKRNGCVGAIIDGCARDAKKIMEIGFPLFVRGYSPYDSNGRTDVIAIRVPIMCGDVPVNQGDLIFADFDGVVVIPSEIADEVVEKALAKVQAEDTVRDELGEGVTATEVFGKYGVL